MAKAKKAAAPAAANAKTKSSQKAAQICKEFNVSEVWENDKGEFFTAEDRALISVDQDRKKLKKHSAGNEVASEEFLDDDGDGKEDSGNDDEGGKSQPGAGANKEAE